MNNLPSGTVTFLFTDIEGSTKLAQDHPQEMPQLLARHNAILNQAIDMYHGFVFRIVGDFFLQHFIQPALHCGPLWNPNETCSMNPGRRRRSKCGWAFIPAPPSCGLTHRARRLL